MSKNLKKYLRGNQLITSVMAEDFSKKYVKKDQRQHVLDRSSMYIGNIDADLYDLWLVNEEGNQMEKKQIRYVPGLFKIFDEIIANASDHYYRLKGLSKSDDNVNLVKDIKVNINKETGVISVYNSGDGIDIALHPEHKIYIPELVFGNLLTSTNYNDDEIRDVIGVFGVGGKASNIFSTWFEVETVDAKSKQIYKQRFENNMSITNPPEIKKCAKKPYTLITFLPDYARFAGGMPGLSDDMYEVMRKRVYDLCAVTDKDINIYFNDLKLEFKSFEKYVDLYIGTKSEQTRVYESISERWEVIASYNNFGGFEQVSFVNGLLTIRGGKHVDYIVNQIVKKITEMIEKKCKGKQVKANAIKDNLIVFIKSTITNPAFDSQSKETLTTPATKFGSKAEISDKFIEKLYKSGLVEKVMEINAIHEEKALKKTDGKKRDIIRGLPKLSDANWAGTLKSKECLLLLTEGDSSASMAISGISEIGREKYGVFPLKGKVMNVKDVSSQKIADNDEIANIKKILGLETGKKYTSIDDLRYGGIMLMTDQDSVTGDTPILLRKNDLIEIRTIDTLCDDWEYDLSGKEYGKSDYEIWTENGWTNIVHVMRHKVQKRIFRVLTHTGLVDVTEDHSLLTPSAEKISPKDLQVDMKLLHKFPSFQDQRIIIPDNVDDLHRNELTNITSTARIYGACQMKVNELRQVVKEIKNNTYLDLQYNTYFDKDEAYVMGLFWADGSCDNDNPRWRITNCNLDFLNKAKHIVDKKYTKTIIIPRGNKSNFQCKYCHVYWQSNADLEKHYMRQNECSPTKTSNFIIREEVNHRERGYTPLYQLELRNPTINIEFVSKYRNMFYDHCKKKRVPPEILNAPLSIREAFFQGYYDGDGVKRHPHHKKQASMRFDVDGKIGAAGLYFLSRSLGYLVSMNIRKDKPNVIRLNITKGMQQDNPNRIKKIWDLGTTEQYVYDLETENHHFQAGVGQLIAHNTDGFHIRGLLMNLFHSLWPSLLTDFKFIHCLNTPIVKAKRRNEIISFYTITDFENWNAENNGNNVWDIKYYKGLGTSTEDEAKEYFRNMKMVSYKFTENSDGCLDLAFNKKRADDRKNWLGEYNRQNVLEYTTNEVTYEDFINKELIHFSNYDVQRSIPSMVDGLKISQRKILYACFKRNLTDKEIRVAQLAAYVSEHAAYHHGETSLQGAIISMAQNFVGSNNINLLYPSGQMGSRLMYGKDSAQPRYIHTLLTQVALSIFKKADNSVLNYLDDDGLSIEPEYYVPIIPMILVNGALGIGTGFSTTIPQYNPMDIVRLLRRMLNSEHVSSEFDDLKPWYRGFTGGIKKIGPKYYSIGRFEKVGATKIIITELPIGYATFDFKEDLEKLLDKIPEFKKYEDASAGNKVHFTLHFTTQAIVTKYLEIESNGFTKLENDFKLTTSKLLATTNMYAFNAQGQITKYDTVFDVINEFYEVRLDYYQKRKAFILGKLENDMELLQNKIRFIKEVVSERLQVHKMKKSDLEDYLETNTFKKYDSSFDYIIRIPVYNLTTDKVAELEADIIKALDDLNYLKDKRPEDVWKEELDEFEKTYDKFLAEDKKQPTKKAKKT